mgnify:CR=1 FL=1
MAYLNLTKKTEPVNFGGRECTPKIDAETNMRLSQINKYDEAAIRTLAAAFPEDEEFVRDFLHQMSIMEIQELHAYLVGGAKMVEFIREKIKDTLTKAIEEAKVTEAIEEVKDV